MATDAFGTFGRKVWLKRSTNRADACLGTWWSAGGTVLLRCPDCGADQHIDAALVKPPLFLQRDAGTGFVESITCVGCGQHLYVMLRNYTTEAPNDGE